MRHYFSGGVAAGLVLVCASVWAQSSAVYSCVDDRGRRLVSDRPIPECLDREQRVLGPSGVERQPLPPVLTKSEREQAAREREHQQRERERIAEQRRLNQALLLRYPDRNAYEAARLQQAQQLDEVQAMARARLASLDELYLQAQKDLAAQGSKPTPEAQRAVKAAQMAVAAQKQSIETNELNRQRTMLRFDDEGRLLEKLWAGEQP